MKRWKCMECLGVICTAVMPDALGKPEHCPNDGDDDAEFVPVEPTETAGYVDLYEVLKAVADEPEYPGDAPPKLCAVLDQAIENKDLDLLLHAMRQTVRLTKQCITDRIKSIKAV